MTANVRLKGFQMISFCRELYLGERPFDFAVPMMGRNDIFLMFKGRILDNNVRLQDLDIKNGDSVKFDVLLKTLDLGPDRDRQKQQQRRYMRVNAERARLAKAVMNSLTASDWFLIHLGKYLELGLDLPNALEFVW